MTISLYIAEIMLYIKRRSKIGSKIVVANITN